MSGSDLPSVPRRDPPPTRGVGGEADTRAQGALAPRSAGSLRAALAWGLLWAAIGVLVLHFLAPNPWPIQSSRATELRASLAVLDRGGPPLLGYTQTGTPYAIGYSDDQGIYVIVPLLSHWLGGSDPIAVLRWLAILAWALTLSLSSVVFRALFRSRWAASVAPPALLVCIVSFGFGDIYWVAAWAVVTLMPALLLIARRKPRHSWLGLALIALIAGIATTIRSDAGLAIAFAAAGVAAMAGGRRSPRIAAIAIVALAYLIPGRIVLPAIRAHRDHRVGVALSAGSPTSHPLWHSLYIGLGYTSNRYGIHYADGYAAAAAHEVDAGAPYLSPAYARALRKQVDRLIGSDPTFVAGAEAQKAVVEASHAGRYILLLALLLPASLAAAGPARLRPSELALFLPALLIGALPAIVAVPFRDYELTLLAPLGALGLLVIGSAAARAEGDWLEAGSLTAGARARARLTLRRILDTWPTRATARAMLVSVAVLAPTTLFAHHLEQEHEKWDNQARNPPRVVLAAARASGPPGRE